MDRQWATRDQHRGLVLVFVSYDHYYHHPCQWSLSENDHHRRGRMVVYFFHACPRHCFADVSVAPCYVYFDSSCLVNGENQNDAHVRHACESLFHLRWFHDDWHAKNTVVACTHSYFDQEGRKNNNHSNHWFDRHRRLNLCWGDDTWRRGR